MALPPLQAHQASRQHCPASPVRRTNQRIVFGAEAQPLSIASIAESIVELITVGAPKGHMS